MCVRACVRVCVSVGHCSPDAVCASSLPSFFATLLIVPLVIPCSSRYSFLNQSATAHYSLLPHDDRWRKEGGREETGEGRFADSSSGCSSSVDSSLAFSLSPSFSVSLLLSSSVHRSVSRFRFEGRRVEVRGEE